MERILEILAANAMTAAAIAIPAAIASRRKRHAVAHVLWVLVLAKLVVPAAVGIRVLPDLVATPPVTALPLTTLPVTTLPMATAAILESGAPGVPASPAPAAPSPSPSGRLAPALVAAEVGGALLVLALAGLRALRFRRLLDGAATAGLESRAGRIARSLGLRSAPRVRLVPATIPPALWPGPRCEILVPSALWHRLSEDERDALLAHELAHVRRRDHWVRPLELLATALFWWYPLAWWARRALRASEEACCDALVLRRPQARPRAYARALLETLAFLAENPGPAAPALATGAGEFPRFQERLVMIMRQQVGSPASRSTRAGLLIFALAALLVGPARTTGAVSEREAPETPVAPVEPLSPLPPLSPTPAAEAPEAPPVPEPPEATPAPEAVPAPEVPWSAELQRLQEREIALQREIEELEAERARLELRMEEWRLQSEALRVEHEAAELERQGREEEANVLREQLSLFEAQLELHKAHLEAREAQRRNEREMEERMRELDLRRREAPQHPAPRAR